MPDRLRLPEVTICAADTAFVDLTVRALTLSMDQCEFADAILFSDAPRAGPFRNVPIAPLKSIADYSRFCLRDLANHIETPFALVIQWDGYVVNASAWKNAFLKYDYIGAVWPEFEDGRSVGNGGFSLRSRRLLKAVQKLPIGTYLEDFTICQLYRKTLERDSGLRFAPPKLARQFSYEQHSPSDPPTFGFHRVDNLSRHCTDDDLAAIVATFDIDKMNPEKILQLVGTCIENGKVRSVDTLYWRLRGKHPPLIIQRALRRALGEVAGNGQFAALEANYTNGRPRVAAT